MFWSCRRDSSQRRCVPRSLLGRALPLRRESRVLFPVDIATVADADHLYEQPVVVNFIDNPVVTDTHPVRIRFAHYSNASRWPRFTGEQIDDRPDSLLLIPRYKSERLEGSTSDLDPVAVHTNPRSAFACSQGT